MYSYKKKLIHIYNDENASYIENIQHQVDSCINKTSKLQPLKNKKSYRKCLFDSCAKNSSYNYINEKPIYCNIHKKENMINVISKICQVEFCNTRSSYNYKNKMPKYCSTHKEKNMINVVSKKCKFESCLKQPSFNYVNKMPIFCIDHKEPNMINIRYQKRLDKAVPLGTCYALC